MEDSFWLSVLYVLQTYVALPNQLTHYCLHISTQQHLRSGSSQRQAKGVSLQLSPSIASVDYPWRIMAEIRALQERIPWASTDRRQRCPRTVLEHSCRARLHIDCFAALLLLIYSRSTGAMPSLPRWKKEGTDSLAVQHAHCPLPEDSVWALTSTVDKPPKPTGVLDLYRLQSGEESAAVITDLLCCHDSSVKAVGQPRCSGRQRLRGEFFGIRNGRMSCDSRQPHLHPIC